MPSGLPGENDLRDGNAAAAPDRLIQARASKDVKSKTLFHRAEQRRVLLVCTNWNRLDSKAAELRAGRLIKTRSALSALAFPVPIPTAAEHAIIARLTTIAIGCRHREAKPQ